MAKLQPKLNVSIVHSIGIVVLIAKRTLTKLGHRESIGHSEPSILD